jgi:hypothetical protein
MTKVEGVMRTPFTESVVEQAALAWLETARIDSAG